MTRPLRVLFVCTQNKLRSPTAESTFSGRPDLEVASAGTARDAANPISRDLLEWANVAVCIEKVHRAHPRQRLRGTKPDEAPLSLSIPDEYEDVDATLVALLERLGPPRLEKFQRRLKGEA